MAKANDGFGAVSPARVIEEIAAAVPADCRANLIIIGSLAVGHRYLADRNEMVVRTKDADCLLSPRVAAVPSGTAITEQLVASGWRFRPTEQWPRPGSADTPDNRLPAVRLQPPDGSEWFLELLTVPASPGDPSGTWLRLETDAGHFGICSFAFLALANYEPLMTDHGIAIARPEMLALANLLEHPEIGPETMSGGFAGLDEVKRSNKDLGRVVAIAWLATDDAEDALAAWPGLWKQALRSRFPDTWWQLAGRAGDGLRHLLQSPNDLQQAHFTCVNGLLASRPPTLDAFGIAARRLLQEAIEPLEKEDP